jgi:hypothetical protein
VTQEKPAEEAQPGGKTQPDQEIWQVHSTPSTHQTQTVGIESHPSFLLASSSDTRILTSINQLPVDVLTLPNRYL